MIAEERRTKETLEVVQNIYKELVEIQLIKTKIILDMEMLEYEAEDIREELGNSKGLSDTVRLEKAQRVIDNVDLIEKYRSDYIEVCSDEEEACVIIARLQFNVGKRVEKYTEHAKGL